mgnify:CR=1 FL=1
MGYHAEVLYVALDRFLVARAVPDDLKATARRYFLYVHDRHLTERYRRVFAAFPPHLQRQLHAGAKVAVVGPACGAVHSIDVEADDWKAGDYYVTGGSGRVVSSSDAMVTVERGLRRLTDDELRVETAGTERVDTLLEAMRGRDAAIACGERRTDPSFVVFIAREAWV